MNLENVVAKIVTGLTVLSVFIEVSKIKINPWSALFNWVGQSINKDIKLEIKDVKKTLSNQSEQINSLGEKVDRNEIKRIRAEILEFADSLRIGVKHTKDNFDHIIEIHDDYVALLEELGMTNGRITVEFDYILRIYSEQLNNGDLI